MHINLLEYNHDYSMLSGSMWNYHRYKIDGVDDMPYRVNHLNIRQK